MVKYTPEFKSKVLSEYCAGQRGHTFQALANRYNITGGKGVVQRWYSSWDGSFSSLRRKKGSGRQFLLNRKQVNKLIVKPITRANQSHVAIHYPELKEGLEQEIDHSISIQTIRRYGRKQGGIKSVRTTAKTENECKFKIHCIVTKLFPICSLITNLNLSYFFFKLLVSDESCKSIASLRRKLMKHSKSKVLFLDETALRLNAAPLHTLVAPGQEPYVVVEDTSSYAARYDMIACTSGDRNFPPFILSPKDRAARKVNGVTKDIILEYIEHILAQAVGELDLYPLCLVVDASPAHNASEMLETFQYNGCQDMETIYIMPTNSAKRMSPLDNSLFHYWKELCRKSGPITKSNIIQIMSDSWNNIDESKIKSYYKHCGLICGTDPYFDCPNPSSHNHHLH